MVLSWQGQVLWREGTLPRAAPAVGLGAGPIALKAAETGRPVYLPALQNLPGRVELSVLPANTPCAVVLSVGDSGTLAVAANKARGFSQRDLEVIFLLTQPIADVMKETSASKSPS